MANLQITWPKGSKPIKSRCFVASGWADETVLGVFGECRPMLSPGPAISGRTLAYHLDGGRGNQGLFYRWMIGFKVPDRGRHELRVTGLTADGRVEVSRRDFTVELVRTITITSPENNEDISTEASYFAPYGELTVNPLGNVTMTDAYSNVVLPIYSYGDCTDYDIWTAQFPTIPQGTWILRAADSLGANVATVTGLIVQ